MLLPRSKPAARRRTTASERPSVLPTSLATRHSHSSLTPKPIAEAYSVLVECADERQQRQLYEQLQAQGLKCRVLTL